MAVYKATHCYPMLNNIDARIVATAENTKPAEYIKCKIDTSNKAVTGYSVRILDSLNNQLFPVDDTVIISPISELSGLIESEEYINTGLNGSYLHVPFFQNRDSSLYTDHGVADGERILPSYNAIYYQAKFMAHHILLVSDFDVGKWGTRTVGSNVYLVNDGWDGMINGEKALVDEIVLSLANDNIVGGLWKFQQDGSLARYEINRGLFNIALDFTQIQNCGVLITRGSAHNTVYTYDTSVNLWRTDINNGWQDIGGHQLVWHNMGDSYKWEITLYQGEGIEDSTGVAKSISYSDMDYTWYDMVMQSGTILGTTNKRLQLGSNDDTYLNANIPAGTETDPLVLQGRYAQLIDYNGNPLGSRGYIQSYDASFGFAYPIADSFSISDITNSEKVMFYKHSNDPAAISASDIVKYATTEEDGNIPGLYGVTENIASSYTYYMASGTPSGSTKQIDGQQPALRDTVFCHSNHAIYKVTDVTLDENAQITSITYEAQSFTYDSNAYYEIKSGNQYGGGYYHNNSITVLPAPGLRVIDGNQTEEGDLVLVQHQTNPWENGIYIAHSEGSTKRTRWVRSGSYKTWGSFIGKIIYVERGNTNGGRNFECLANAGGTLYTGGTLGSGQSPLYFTEEKPLVLFSNYLYSNGIDLVKNGPIDTTEMNIDGTEIKAGMVIYFAHAEQMIDDYGGSITVTSVNEGVSWSYNHDWDAEGNELYHEVKYLYVRGGQTYGHAVVRTYRGAITPSELIVNNLYAAFLLKNQRNRTYISPYVNLRKDMALKLQDYHTVTYASGRQSEWITIDGINKNTWCIKHLEIKKALKSFDDLDAEVPYTYEVRSFYRTSDENIFYCYETPYLKLSYNGEGYSDLITWQPYEVAGTNTWDEYDVLNPPSTYLDFMVRGASLSAIADRYVTLQGFYHQFQKLSWVSYRWVLTDSLGNILQDTGKKFDKNMEVSFYGLANDVDSNIYYAILYVEDELKQTLTFTVKLIVDPQNASSLNLPFHATYDCQSHSVVLEYDDNGQILPSIATESNMALGYIEKNKNSITGWDDSVVYKNNQLYITGEERSLDTQIINRYASDSKDIANTSLTSKRGLEYSHYFPSNDTIVPLDTHKMSLDSEVLSLQTEVQLDDNYCGDFLTVDLVSELSDRDYIRLVLSTDAGMQRDSRALNSGRYNIRARLEAISNGVIVGDTKTGILQSSTEAFNWHSFITNSSDPTTIYQTLQPYIRQKDIIDHLDKFVTHRQDFQYSILGESFYPWYTKNKNGQIYNTYGSTVLGNICLINAEDLYGISDTGLDGINAKNTTSYCFNSLPYWVEDRQHLVLVKTYSPLQQVDYITMSRSSGALAPEKVEYDENESYYPQYWPASGVENKSYWVEIDQGASGNPFFNNLNGVATYVDLRDKLINSKTFNSQDYIKGNNGITRVVAMPRYYDILSKQKWEININCQNLSSLYTALISGGIIIQGNGGDNYGITFSYGGNVCCKVLLKPTLITNKKEE